MKSTLSRLEIIAKIKAKTTHAKPIIRTDFFNRLGNKSISDLERINKSIRVDKDGTGIRYSK
jgi:hypothetical protein